LGVLNDKNIKLEKDVITLTKMHEKAAKDYENANKMIKSLEKTLLEFKIKNEEIETLKNELNDRNEEIGNLKIASKNACEVSARLNKDLNDYKLKLSTEIAAIKEEHKKEVKAWKKSLGEEKMNMQKQFEKKLREEVAAKDAEISKVCNEKVELEEKVNSLLDSLYGCNHCGRQACALECEEYEEFLKAENEIVNDENADEEKTDEENVEQDSTGQTELRLLISGYALPAMETSVTPSHPPPQPSGCSAPWTPPPTPPCSKCGSDNYGPCPGNVCFSCIPQLQASSPTRRSPSTTPPGTPPPLRGSQQSQLTYRLTASSSNHL